VSWTDFMQVDFHGCEPPQKVSLWFADLWQEILQLWDSCMYVKSFIICLIPILV